MKRISTKLIFAVLAFTLSTGNLQAADWLMLQGTEKSFVKKDGKVVKNTRRTPVIWGFMQVNYKRDFGNVLDTGINKTPFSLLIPDLKSQSGVNLGRGRLSARGMMDEENKINYFTMLAFENSGITNLMNTRATTGEVLVDASVTLKHIPYAKLRIGQFKTPGSEEGLRATFASPYIEFTSFTNGELMERQTNVVGSAQTGGPAGGATTVHYQGDPYTSVSAFRDKGVQVFDTVALSFIPNYKLTYAYMYGNGSNLKMYSPSGQGTHYAYLALEKEFGKGKGFYTESLKTYIWGQSGNREIITTDAGIQTNKRKRYGVGMTYYKDGLRVTSELMGAEGMIFTGAKDSDPTVDVETWQVQHAVGVENKSVGGYFNVQYEIVPKKFEIFSRYDQYNRLTNDTKAERIFKTLTIGASYRFKGPTRVDINYAMRDALADGNAGAQTVLDNIGNRFMVQFTGFFKN
ncbi:hypothetical protein HUE87_10960 [Candidatus Sulfurimonas marisnigri]|uniref:Porin n=1 Tax=Candidatus Sulfurimonas marisnigri TaxID=2740405 RepID=A0A7S7LZP6_9BACT|nr:hypothetical protein [Candidatus Sulfurimonas marisnigri]QOY54384.1 hypothetical protein HUE87_10960 [Candidatus Sulfurimonas marisnigri]